MNMGIVDVIVFFIFVIPLMILALILFTLGHELSHALVAKRYNRESRIVIPGAKKDKDFRILGIKVRKTRYITSLKYLARPMGIAFYDNEGLEVTKMINITLAGIIFNTVVFGMIAISIALTGCKEVAYIVVVIYLAYIILAQALKGSDERKVFYLAIKSYITKTSYKELIKAESSTYELYDPVTKVKLSKEEVEKILIF